MKKLIPIAIILMALSSCSSYQVDKKNRSMASDPCAERYFVNEYNYFEYYEMCHDL
ncbi:putative lipoprotein [Bacteriovorax sp. Seq25_V]|uniref:putative lipoprotein n=1 Tax=Bacteriovorax sp. Seq25_V TaxID=1201288 RepID=UPI000389FFCE|nr:putative lipoprotein [Bacteriovorax sp. Seq25_V]EQC44211.1 putative lipoprotein [Bacteriovorax sp. Seq25_V]